MGDKLRVFFLPNNSTPIFLSWTPSNFIFSIRSSSLTSTCKDFFSEFLYHSPFHSLDVCHLLPYNNYFYICALSPLLDGKDFEGRNFLLNHLVFPTLTTEINKCIDDFGQKQEKKNINISYWCSKVRRGYIYDWQHRLEPLSSLLIGQCDSYYSTISRGRPHI